MSLTKTWLMTYQPFVSKPFFIYDFMSSNKLVEIIFINVFFQCG